MQYRYKNIHGTIKYGDTVTARHPSAVIWRVLDGLEVGQRSTSMRSAGILWIERLS